MIKHTPWKIGFLQASGLTLYVATFASIIQAFSGTSVQPPPFLAISIFLLTFLISATVCASIALTYPIVLFFNSKRKEAFQVIVWTIGWLVIFFSVFLMLYFIYR